MLSPFGIGFNFCKQNLYMVTINFSPPNVAFGSFLCVDTGSVFSVFSMTMAFWLTLLQK